MREPLAWREDLEWVRLESPMVWCWRCHQMKSRESFSPSTIRSPEAGCCRRCHRKYTSEWAKKNPEKLRESRRRSGGEYSKRNREKINDRLRRRYAADPEYRAQRLATTATWARANKEKRNANQRARYASDPTYRARLAARTADYHQRKKAEKEQQ